MRRPQTRNVERTKQVKWLQHFRESTQHLSIAIRPRMTRTMWMKFGHKKDSRKNK